VRTYLLTQRASSPVPLVTDHGTGRGRSLERGASAQVATSNGFDWADAGIGAAGALGAFLLAGGAALSARKRRPLAQAHR
jgi:hypothetical protein